MKFLYLPLSIVLLLANPVGAAEEYTSTGVLTGSLRVLGALVLIIGLVLLIYALGKKRFSLFSGQKQGNIRVIEMRYLAPKKAVALIEVRGREMLVGVGQVDVSLLCQLDNSASFEKTLRDQLEETL